MDYIAHFYSKTASTRITGSLAPSANKTARSFKGDNFWEIQTLFECFRVIEFSSSLYLDNLSQEL